MTAPNAELAYRVLDHIDAHPEQWDQRTWDCGTVACFAGWAVRLSGARAAGPAYDSKVVEGPADLIGLDVSDAAVRVLRHECWTPDSDIFSPRGDLFASDNTREDLGRLVAEYFGPRPGSAS